MNVGSELKEAQFEQIEIADEAGSGKESGRVYWNTERLKMQVGDGANLINFGQSSAAIGDVKHSMLTEAQFQAEVDTTWVLSDGRNVIGSDYHALTGFPIVPDCRGQFLRGLNNGRADGQENPDGGALLGLQQTDEVGPHDHTMSLWSRTSPGGGRPGAASDNNQVAPNTDMSTGPETRPKNISVNIFIKINRLV